MIVATGWAALTLVPLNLVAQRAGWWSFHAEGAVWQRMPVDLVLAWVLLWGALPATMIFAIANVPMLMRHGLQVEQAREGLAGPSVKLMRTVAEAIKEDLGTVKDALDIFVRAPETPSFESRRLKRAARTPMLCVCLRFTDRRAWSLMSLLCPTWRRSCLAEGGWISGSATNGGCLPVPRTVSIGRHCRIPSSFRRRKKKRTSNSKRRNASFTSP